jgi:predicted TIM-barrel fold metal-dependent hydrolase
MVQVTVTSLPCLAGSRFLHPIYEACDELSLPFNLHVGGGDAGVNPGSYPVGRPTTFSEYHLGMCIPALYHVMNMVMEGVFIKYPRIKLVLNEFGVAWLPFVSWRLDMEYRAARDDTPWLTKLPSEYIREFVRFSTQPLEEPGNPKDLVALLSLMHGDEVLMFSSDYPHWDADNPDVVLKAFPDEWKQKIFFDNARDVFRLDQRLGGAVALAGAAA